jgi:hypothetical protein
MLPSGWLGKFRGHGLWQAKILREPAEAALIAQIKMQPDPAVARGGLKGGFCEGSWYSICAKAIGADEAWYGVGWKVYCSTGSSKVMRRI